MTETLNTAIQIQNDVSQKQSSVETARKEVAQNAAKIDELVKGVTPETIGAVAQKGDTAENVVSYTSNDAANPSSYTDVDLLKSGETHKSVLQKISTMFKNIRYLYKMLGTADISALGDGTILGALSTLNSNIGTKLSNTDIKISSKTYTITSFTEWWGMYAWDTSYSDIGIPNNAKIISVYIGTCSGNATLCATRFYNTSATNIRVIFSRNNPTTFTLCVCYLVG